jgi:hypothetical protein
MFTQRGLALVLLLSGTSASCAEPLAAPSPAGERAILFIGNSLTAQNDLPRRVRDLARDAGLEVDAVGIVGSGFSLGDHLDAGVQTKVGSRRWELVVLQQGPSTLPQSRVELVRDATALAEVIRAAGSESALLAIWPLPGQKQQDVTASYRAAAEAVKGRLFRAGDAWEAAARARSNTDAHRRGRLPSLAAGITPGRAHRALRALRQTPLGRPGSGASAHGPSRPHRCPDDAVARGRLLRALTGV